MFEKDPKMKALLKKKHYVVLKKLAHGAFGQVYKGARTDEHDKPIMDKLVAIKVVEMTKLGPAFRTKYLPQVKKEAICLDVLFECANGAEVILYLF